MSITVLYFFQCEAGESLSLPNAFMMPKGADSEPTFGTFLEHFPVKNQALHFRFKWEGGNQEYMWLDMTTEADKLPIIAGQIMVKILKLDDISAFRRRKILRYKKTESMVAMNGSLSAENMPSQAPSSSSVSRISPPPSHQQPTARTITPPPQQQQQQQSPQAPDVVDFFGDEADSKPSSTRRGGEGGYQGAADFGLDIDDAGGGSMMTSAPPEEPAAPLMSREELAARREQDIDDKVQEALEEKRERDRKEETESAETEAARLKHDVNLKSWTYKNNAKRDVRSLLSNMHTVTWPGARWKQIGLGDLLEPKQVKLQYRKAMLVVHPDRCSSMDTETKFIAKRLFEGINEAYEEFLKKESV